jgi:uncharacterized membrane protein HdeD (DUF308 family)
MRVTRVLAWAWMIIVGVLMITPRGVICIACGKGSPGYIGDAAVLVVGLVSLALGAFGLVGALRERVGATGQVART